MSVSMLFHPVVHQPIFVGCLPCRRPSAEHGKDHGALSRRDSPCSRVALRPECPFRSASTGAGECSVGEGTSPLLCSRTSGQGSSRVTLSSPVLETSYRTCWSPSLPAPHISRGQEEGTAHRRGEEKSEKRQQKRRRRARGRGEGGKVTQTDKHEKEPVGS